MRRRILIGIVCYALFGCSARTRSVCDEGGTSDFFSYVPNKLRGEYEDCLKRKREEIEWRQREIGNIREQGAGIAQQIKGARADLKMIALVTTDMQQRVDQLSRSIQLQRTRKADVEALLSRAQSFGRLLQEEAARGRAQADSLSKSPKLDPYNRKQAEDAREALDSASGAAGEVADFAIDVIVPDPNDAVSIGLFVGSIIGFIGGRLRTILSGLAIAYGLFGAIKERL